jgi:hypothetical protein
MTESLEDLVTALSIENPRRLWGVSPESTYAALAAVATDQAVESALDGYRKLALAATNQEGDREAHADLHRRLVRELGLATADGVTELGALLLRSDDPKPLLQTLVIAQTKASRRLLRDCLSIDGFVPRREYESLLRDTYEEAILTPLLGSFEIIRVFPDGAEVAADLVDSGLEAHDACSVAVARASLYRHLLASYAELTPEVAGDITNQYLGRRGSEAPSAQAIVGTLAPGRSRPFDSAGLSEAIEELRREYGRRADRYSRLLAERADGPVVTDEPYTGAEIREHIDSDIAANVVDLLTMITAERLQRVDAGYVALKLRLPRYDAFTTLNAIPEVDCSLQDGCLVFERVPTVSAGENNYERYVDYLLEEHRLVATRRDAVAAVDIILEGVHVAEHLSRRITAIESRQVAPTYFTYTLIDPDALGEETMERYVGDSQGLGRERALLRRWQADHATDLRSYTAMTDRLFSLGLEENLNHQVLRIMTPFDDDTFSEYASQLRRLLEAGHELRFLTRHTKDPWEWRRLRDNLLKQLEANRDRVVIRTYSRFKEHQRVTQQTDFKNLGELGIHGKLNIIGGPREGAALVGSANFMENSYHWNPECGVYTEQTAFVRAATEFFDVVWELAETDQLSLERLQEIPNRQFIPSYYTR